MNSSKIQKIFQDNPGPRDYVFERVLKQHGPVPLFALQVGGIRKLNAQQRIDDGWGDCFWATHIAQCGGALTVCDINEDALQNSLKIAMEYRIPFGKLLMTGKEALKKSNDYDVIYLDGGGNPKQMLDQFKLCDRERSIILCDDWTGKGALLMHVDEDFEFFEVESKRGMAIYWRK